MSIFAYEWFIARVALRIGFGAAAAVAALDFLLSLTIQLSADFMLGVGSMTDAGLSQP